jgi:hypothetical protein
LVLGERHDDVVKGLKPTSISESDAKNGRSRALHGIMAGTCSPKRSAWRGLSSSIVWASC